MKIANILMSNVWGAIGPEALERGIGGREGAMIYLSREWAKLGHEVTNFVDVELGNRFVEDDKYYSMEQLLNKSKGYHEYIPLNMTKPMLANFPWDVAIAWECPTVFEDSRIKNKIKLRICEMQVCHFPSGQMLAAEENCQYVAALSDWHKDFMLFSGLSKHPDMVTVFPNGVDISRYPIDQVKFGLDKRMPPKFIYSSSPDRGLLNLLKSWRYIREEFPEAELSIAYGAKNWIEYNKWFHGKQGEMALELDELMRQDGVKDIGKIGQGELAKLQLEATAWLYPLDSIQATESGCITAVEAAAAGCPIVTTNCDCMEEEFGEVGRIVKLPFDPEEYADTVKMLLTDEEYYLELQRKGRQFAETRDWSLIARKWLDLFQKELS